jgi:hypothetical protein
MPLLGMDPALLVGVRPAPPVGGPDVFGPLPVGPSTIGLGPISMGVPLHSTLLPSDLGVASLGVLARVTELQRPGPWHLGPGPTRALLHRLALGFGTAAAFGPQPTVDRPSLDVVATHSTLSTMLAAAKAAIIVAHDCEHAVALA